MDTEVRTVLKQVRAERTRQALIAAAATEFDRHGYAGTPLSAAHRACGMTMGAFTIHFRSECGPGVAACEAAPARTVPRDLGLTHQPLDPFAAHVDALALEHGVHTRRAVGPTRVGVDLLDLLGGRKLRSFTYVRGTSNTRPARSGEVLALVERVRGGGKPPIGLEVQLLGPICRVDRVDEILESLRGYEEEQFTKQPTPAEDTFASTAFRLTSNVFGSPKPLSTEDREQALAAWQSKKAEHIAKGREHFLGVGMPGAGVQLVSRDRFVAKPHLILTFHNCELLDYLDPDDADVEKTVEPVLRPHDPFLPSFDYSTLRPLPRGYPVTWSNHGEDAEVVLTPESFRPNVPWTSDQDDYVIIARDPQASSVEVSWELTEDGTDAVTSGELRVPTEPLVDAADLFKSVFLGKD